MDVWGDQLSGICKPVRGSASIAINKVKDKETMDLLWAHDDNLMIQEFLNGQEIAETAILI